MSARMSTMGAARRVDEDRVALHLRDGCGVDHFARFVSQRAMQADHVADGQQILQALDSIDADGDLGAARRIRVVGDDVHTEGLGAESGSDANASEAYDAEDPST
jgi:hypothetical protein